MTKNGDRKRWLWAAVCAAGVGAAILLYVATRPGPPVEPVPPDEPLPEEEAVDPPAPEAPGWVDEPGEPAEFPEGVRWLTEDTFVETGRGGRGMVSRWDADGDGLYDADEFMMYGTLRYDARTRTSATRIDILPHGSTEVFVSTRTREGMRFRRMAKRPLTPEEDTDGDGLPDAWEMHWFGHLDYGPYDDPDGDGFPNIIEWSSTTTCRATARSNGHTRASPASGCSTGRSSSSTPAPCSSRNSTATTTCSAATPGAGTCPAGCPGPAGSEGCWR